MRIFKGITIALVVVAAVGMLSACDSSQEEIASSAENIVSGVVSQLTHRLNAETF